MGATPVPTASLVAALLAAAVLLGCGGSSPRSSSTAVATVSTASASPRTALASTNTATLSSTRPQGSRVPKRRRASRPHTRPAVARTAAATVPRPPIVFDPIPFGPQRKAEMLAYAQRHYGLNTYRLVDPQVIVIHYTDTPDFSSTFNTFAPDTPDSELHELPNTCAHFVIDGDGTIHQLVPLGIMCRHTVGLNWTAIGIEHVGSTDQEVLDNPREFAASLALVHWLRCRFHIAIANVIGHNESLSSPYHHENIPALRTQTHGDFVHADMNLYRAKLAAAGGCS